jgi:hypothetical protein
MSQQTRLYWIRKGFGVVPPLAALLPAVWVLTHPMSVVWLRPFCKETWPVLAACALAAVLPFLFRRKGTSTWSLLVIALIQAAFQAWCYNTGSHPAVTQSQIWGIFPFGDSNFYYSGACELLNGQQMTLMFGARESFPLLLAVLLKILRHDFRLVTLVLTIVMVLATWSAFEVIRLRLGGLAAAVFLACVTFLIRIYCVGSFMTEQLAVLYSLCAVAMLVESVATRGKAKGWFFWGGVFFLAQALNARPAAYLVLPFLVLFSWQLCDGSPKVRGKVVFLGAIAVAMSFLLHGITYDRAVGARVPSNSWYCIYGMLNGGTWRDGIWHSQRLLPGMPNPMAPYSSATDRLQALLLLRAECLSEIRDHPSKFLSGWWRAVQFLWSNNTPFRTQAVYQEVPSAWVTESARWCAVLGLGLSLFLLLRGTRLGPNFKTYQELSWINLAGFLGMLASLPFAPPWDGDTRIYSATLPMFFLLPASFVGGLYLLIVRRFHHTTVQSNAHSPAKFAIGSALIIGGTLSVVITSASWWLVGTDPASKNRQHPVRLMTDELIKKTAQARVRPFDLRSLRAGYHLRLTDDTQPTWLPKISRKDFIQSLPIGPYSPLSSTFNQLPPGSELVVLPYYVWLVLDKEDARAQRFTPRPEQTGHRVWPPIYFSKGLNIQNQ